ncbi:MAG: hypothetical protein CFE25_13960 [Chitinophagaceae bacterium BSSC1]|jgi:curved DNA-binding protein CbpA|nr:MAG: hypothetical protein CFE25_13960 [Chitinophagaceae bacterium BSSC1]
MAQNFLTYYQLLGVESNATEIEISHAYKEKAKEYHPDKNGGHSTATKLFQFIQDAKEVLMDQNKRTEYDYIIGVKERPMQIIQSQMLKRENNVEELLAIGALGLLVGVFLKKK